MRRVKDSIGVSVEVRLEDPERLPRSSRGSCSSSSTCAGRPEQCASSSLSPCRLDASVGLREHEVEVPAPRSTPSISPRIARSGVPAGKTIVKVTWDPGPSGSTRRKAPNPGSSAETKSTTPRLGSTTARAPSSSWCLSRLARDRRVGRPTRRSPAPTLEGSAGRRGSPRRSSVRGDVRRAGRTSSRPARLSSHHANVFQTARSGNAVGVCVPVTPGRAGGAVPEGRWGRLRLNYFRHERVSMKIAVLGATGGVGRVGRQPGP